MADPDPPRRGKRPTPPAAAPATPEAEPTPRPFDVRTVEYLIGLMAAHELTEIALQEGPQRIRLRKGGAAAPVVFAAAPTQSAAHAGVSPAAPPAPPPAPAKAYREIKAEMVGTFYSRPKPDKDDFVRVGQAIKPDTTVCLIEAMKIFNDIKAEVAGTVAEVCVKNGDGVDFSTVLFRVDTGA